MAVTMEWDPRQYLNFGDHRLRPFVELLQRFHAEQPHHVVDLGCGPGNATVLLNTRWPEADVLGVDDSPEMISQAKALEVPGHLAFELGDLRGFRPAGKIDVLISNATFQWVPNHRELFPHFVEMLNPGGAFGFQVPGMHESPSHVFQYELATTVPYADKLASQIRLNSIDPTAIYIETLSALGCEVDAWETTYFQVLQGKDAVLEWTKGSSLRPFTSVLEPDEAVDFVERYRKLLAEAYPETSEGTIYPFRRVFVVVHLRA
jgi:trans-aconitate 2-methyltransferase